MAVTLAFLTAALAGLVFRGVAEPARAAVVLHLQPLHSGRIDPKLFGNFVELLDDVVPGMWAELLNDRSFEGVTPAANWSYYDGSLNFCDRRWDTNATWSLDTANSFNGSRSARLVAGQDYAALTQSGLGVKKGLAYSFSGFLRADAGVKVTVLIKCKLPTGEWTSLASSELPSLSPQWQKYSVQLVSLGQTDQAVFELRASGPGQAWVDKLSLMPEDNQLGWRRDVVEAIKEVHPSLIRWGGSCVDPGRYRWKDGIGNRDLRVPWPNRHWGRIDPNDVGLDEFCQFCELTGTEPLVCVSFGDGAANAADLVEYCNGDTATVWGARRAANGHPAPYKVKYWQVGNEISGDDPAYLDQIPQFVAAMKKSDPNAVLMASYPSQKLLDRVGKDIGYVCPHHYTPDLAACDRDFNQIARMIDLTPGCEHLKLGVTEWNIDGGAWGLGRAKQSTLEAALQNARYMNLMMRHSDKVRIACRSNLANSYCGAIIETGASGNGVLKRASFYAMELYSRHALPIPLQLEQSGGETDLFACGSDDKKLAVIFAVNPQREPVNLAVSLKELGENAAIIKAEALCDTLHAGQPDIMNHWQTPERVKIVGLPFSRNEVILPGLSAVAIQCGVN